jgi:Flp pilus assembly protein CpaB
VENLLSRGQGVLGTPKRAIIAGVGALVLAAILLFAYLNHYRNSVKGAAAPITVLVAKKFIPKGTSALALAQSDLFAPTAIPKSQLKEGAVTDAAALHGEVSLTDVFPGQQLTTVDFGISATSSALSGVLTGTQRAISIPLDASHGISPQTQTGDHVDVYVQIGGAMALLSSNVFVLAAPNQIADETTAPVSANYVFRIPTKQVARFLYAAGNGTLWLALRGQKGVSPTPPAIVTGANVLGGQ